MTRAEDKLVAVSALMQEIEPFMRCRYLAGHWETNLTAQLACRMGFQATNKRVTFYRAPSWSWASVDGSIRLPDNWTYDDNSVPYTHLTRVLDVHVHLVSSDNLGQVAGGYLCLGGQLLAVEIHYNDNNAKTILVDGQQTKINFFEEDEDNSLATPSCLYCLPIDIRTGCDVKFSGIVLKQVDGTETYQRIGFIGTEYLEGLHEQRFMSDPLLRLLGQFEWDRQGNAVSHTRDESTLRDIIIV